MPSTLSALIPKGAEHSKELQPLTTHHLRIIKRLAQKAPGLDGVGFLPHFAICHARHHRDLSPEAQSIPNRGISLIALIPKNDIERPIALVASMYRLWCRARAPYTGQWQQEIQHEFFWE